MFYFRTTAIFQILEFQNQQICISIDCKFNFKFSQIKIFEFLKIENFSIEFEWAANSPYSCLCCVGPRRKSSESSSTSLRAVYRPKRMSIDPGQTKNIQITVLSVDFSGNQTPVCQKQTRKLPFDRFQNFP